jgi:iron complex transport system substrate-binding protein
MSVVFWFADTKTPYVAGGLGSASLLADLTGMRNVFGASADDWPAVGWETIVDADPELLVLGDLQRDRFPGDRLDDKIAFLASDPLTRTLPAVQDERYIALHGAELNPSIRFVDALEKIHDWWVANRIAS